MILQWIFHKLQTIISISTDSATDTLAEQLDNPYIISLLVLDSEDVSLAPQTAGSHGVSPTRHWMYYTGPNQAALEPTFWDQLEN